VITCVTAGAFMLAHALLNSQMITTGSKAVTINQMFGHALEDT
jgi:hypothetical protein